MRKWKKASIACMALCAGGALLGGAGATAYAKAEETTSAITLTGASVRMSSPTGIRFETIVEKQEGYTYGTIIIPKNLLGEAELTAETASALNVEATKWQSDESSYTVVLGGANGENGVTNFPELKYNETLVARSYAVKNGVYTYSAAVERTLAYVASKALADTSEEGEITDEISRGFLKTICDSVLGDDAFAFEKTETVIVTGESADLTALYSATNGAEGMAAIWQSDATDVATVDENGTVSVKGEGTAIITAQIGTKSASITVKSGAKIEGTLTGAADGEALAELYGADGNFVAKYAFTATDGRYSVIAESATAKNAAKAIISQGENAAFIDDLSVSKDGEMTAAKYRVGSGTINGKAFSSTVNTYDIAKASASGDWKYAAAYTGTYGLIMPATVTAENYVFTTQMTKPTKETDESGVGITNGEWVLSFQRATGSGGFPYGTRINVHFEKLGTATSYDFTINCGYWNGNDGFHDVSYLGARNQYGNWNTERADAGGDIKNVYGNAIWTIERTGDAVKLYADPIKANAGLQSKLVLTVTASGIVLADSLWASDSYNKLFNSAYGSYEGRSNEIIVEGLKGFFGAGVEHAMAFVSDSRSATAHNVTYKASLRSVENVSRSWTYTATGGNGEIQTMEDFVAPYGDYTMEMTLSGANARGTSGNAGIDILSGGQKGYVRLIFGTDCNNGNGAYLLISDGSVETKTGIILQKDGADYSVGRFNSSSMYVSVKIVRKNGVITISAKSGESKEYTAVLQIDGNGISACDNGYTFLNQNKAALDIVSYFSDKASALAVYTTGVNTFRFFHYSTNGYTYNCSIKAEV
ncbi:MAG: Ig-like domain-containing protein [Candidatus Borkfalkiaceae bacterium]|nr:Ig-like domain-containing protein [Clostridia bacterium]MDY6222753.1 Ig-like domain-containing protein [Christensenellaceae bacterium]